MVENERFRIGFIGFGEVGAALSQRMKEKGAGVFAWDKFPEAAQKKAEELGIPLVETLEELVNRSRLILSCVWPNVALDVARETVTFLSPAKIFCDMNSVSPETTAEIQQVVAPSGAGFVKIATMAGIPDRGYKVPLLAAGTDAREVTETLTHVGLLVENIGADPKHAAAMKILRSICLKGIVALAYEMLRGAEKYGIEDRILESSSEVMGRMSFRDTMDAWISSTAIHARRRANEMQEVIETLNSAGINPIMSVGTKQVFEEIAALGLDKVFQGKIPDSFHRVLEKVRGQEPSRQ
jgi:3-hydroxyisobutyrate dehydrogenase-like beta-hydroxyacid dehydrogenase